MADIKPVDTNPARSDIIGETELKAVLSDHDLDLENALQNFVPDTDAEKRLVRKLDAYMMPTLWVMYILAYLDRQNIVSGGDELPKRCFADRYHQGKRKGSRHGG